MSRKLSLTFDNFKGNKLFFLVIISFEYFSKWSSAKILCNFILICNWITNQDFRIALLICEISLRTDSSRTDIVDLKIDHLLTLKRCRFGTTCSLSFRHRGFFHLCRIELFWGYIILQQIDLFYLCTGSSVNLLIS